AAHALFRGRLSERSRQGSGAEQWQCQGDSGAGVGQDPGISEEDDRGVNSGDCDRCAGRLRPVPTCRAIRYRRGRHLADRNAVGSDGGMAEYVTVPARNLVPLGDADPIAAAPLSDAGLTPYHAIKLALPNLTSGGRSALVIGLGGLGQLAVQMLVALTGAQVI